MIWTPSDHDIETDDEYTCCPDCNSNQWYMCIICRGCVCAEDCCEWKKWTVFPSGCVGGLTCINCVEGQ